MQVRDRLAIQCVKLCHDTIHAFNELSWAFNNAIVNMATAYEYLVMGFKI